MMEARGRINTHSASVRQMWVFTAGPTNPVFNHSRVFELRLRQVDMVGLQRTFDDFGDAQLGQAGEYSGSRLNTRAQTNA